jgi:hypothetical protein
MPENYLHWQNNILLAVVFPVFVMQYLQRQLTLPVRKTTIIKFICRHFFRFLKHT